MVEQRSQRGSMINVWFEQQAAQTPDREAVTFEGQSIRYADLARRARQVAAHLRGLGAGRGSRVGILMPRSIDLVATTLGVMHAGAAFVPLDSAHPNAHLRRVVEDAGLTVVMVDPGLDERLSGLSVPRCTMADVDAEGPVFDGEGPAAGDPAYVIYTSGTTGAPKGVVVAHRSLSNYVRWAEERYGGGEALSFALCTSPAVDLTLTSIFLPLVSGGTVAVYAGPSATALMDALDEDRVTAIKLTPSHLSLAVGRKPGKSRVKKLIVGGEALETRLARQALSSFGGDLEIWNEYGPTEATVGCIVHRFDPERDVQDFVPIGQPAAGCRVHVLDTALAPVAQGTIGELHLAGECLALGYLGNAEATKERFVESSSALEGMLYRTGDLVRQLPSGDLDFVGRNDAQIKLQGHRVELEGIKALLGRHPEVHDAAVVLTKDDGGDGVLTAYYTAERDLGAAELRAFLGEQLHAEIIPRHFVRLPRLPLKESGKVDVEALAALAANGGQAREGSAAPRTEMETTIAAIWSAALVIEGVGVEDDFFELGGHSLLANRIILRIREALGVDLNMRSIFENRTVAALARSIEITKASAGVRIANTESTAGDDSSFTAATAERPEAPRPTGKQSDDENLGRAESLASVDAMVGQFYSRFPWPWNSSKFDTLSDPDFEATMVCQEVGDYTHTALPPEPTIWVAGCGTNQALLTALRFPRARVLGTDLSTKSIEICAENAKKLGVTNLELSLGSINEATYQDQFDFVICTGVIHHTYDPAHALGRLSRALKPAGIMEVLVYNRFHRTITSSFQKAIRIMTSGLGADDFAVAKRLSAGFAVDNTMSRFIARHRDWEESDFADLLINPVEHSYTVDSLAEMAHGQNLDLARPCISLYAKFRAESIFWEMEFSDRDIQRVYDSMADVDRWRVSNLLMHEKSPMLWFYLQRKDSPRKRATEREVNEAFLATTFVQAEAQQTSFIREPDGSFRAARSAGAAPEAAVRAIYDRFDRPRVMGEVLDELGIEKTFASVLRTRVMLTTPAFPHLSAVARSTGQSG
ncbi:MAG: amino acid adenylation domain-containing protein [Minicystis sp.]